MKRKKIMLLFLLVFLASSLVAGATTIAVVDFTNNTGCYLPGIEESATEYLTTYLSGRNDYQVVERAKLKSIITPSGASIEIDGIYYGSTPARIPVTSGIHRVTITMGGYEPWDKKVNFYEGFVVNAHLGIKEVKEDNEDE